MFGIPLFFRVPTKTVVELLPFLKTEQIYSAPFSERCLAHDLHRFIRAYETDT